MLKYVHASCRSPRAFLPVDDPPWKRPSEEVPRLLLCSSPNSRHSTSSSSQGGASSCGSCSSSCVSSDGTRREDCVSLSSCRSSSSMLEDDLLSPSSPPDAPKNSSSTLSPVKKKTVRVWVRCLLQDLEYKTLCIDDVTTSRQLVTSLLSKFRMKHRDPKLFFLTMEITVRKAEGYVTTYLLLEDEARPAQLLACHPRPDSRLVLKARPGAVLRVYDGALSSGSQYKSLLVSEKMTSEELLKLVLLCNNVKASVNDYSLYEVRKSDGAERVLAHRSLTLKEISKWPSRDSCCLVVRYSPGRTMTPNPLAESCLKKESSDAGVSVPDSGYQSGSGTIDSAASWTKKCGSGSDEPAGRCTCAQDKICNENVSCISVKGTAVSSEVHISSEPVCLRQTNLVSESHDINSSHLVTLTLSSESCNFRSDLIKDILNKASAKLKTEVTCECCSAFCERAGSTNRGHKICQSDASHPPVVDHNCNLKLSANNLRSYMSGFNDQQHRHFRERHRRQLPQTPAEQSPLPESSVDDDDSPLRVLPRKPTRVGLLHKCESSQRLSYNDYENYFYI